MAETTKRAKRTPDHPKDDRREGYKLAITMLRELEASPDLCDLCGLDEFVTGRAKPQDNIVYRYLVKCRGRSLDVAAGFCAILSDFAADCSEGLVPKAGTYQKALKIRAPGRGISAADKNRRTWKLMQRITGSRDPMPVGFGTPGWAKKQRDARKSAAAKGPHG
jgi:hypothetical protein